MNIKPIITIWTLLMLAASVFLPLSVKADQNSVVSLTTTIVSYLRFTNQYTNISSVTCDSLVRSQSVVSNSESGYSLQIKKNRSNQADSLMLYQNQSGQSFCREESRGTSQEENDEVAATTISLFQ